MRRFVRRAASSPHLSQLQMFAFHASAILNNSLELPPSATAALMGTTVSSQYMTTHQILKTTHTLSPACRRRLKRVHQCTHRCPCMAPNGTADWEAPWNMNNNNSLWTGFVLLHSAIFVCSFYSHPTFAFCFQSKISGLQMWLACQWHFLRWPILLTCDHKESRAFHLA